MLTPWTLQHAAWPAPVRQGQWVFVTENPVVTAAACGHDGARHARLLCTVGTPSAQELDALARLAALGWRIAARADFDAAGLAHVRAVLCAVPGATAWRMSAADYLRSLHPAPYRPAHLEAGQLPATGWDPALAQAMRARARPAYEEALLEELCADLHTGHPPPRPGHAPGG
ncbi:DUF2399 domain-containing protein [Streptomyces sp. NPDC093991]|uniref:DUF2399 domain-containing protein n=1 Tax=unclassified Streptomyces TaxID=2593676 RepID=UPI003441A52D